MTIGFVDGLAFNSKTTEDRHYPNVIRTTNPITPSRCFSHLPDRVVWSGLKEQSERETASVLASASNIALLTTGLRSINFCIWWAYKHYS